MMSFKHNHGLLPLAGGVAGANVAAAAASIILGSIPVAAPIIGGIVAILALGISGSLEDPDKAILGTDKTANDPVS